MYGKSNMETYKTVCKTDSQQEFAVWLRKLKQELCINQEGQDGEGHGREVEKGKDICIMLRFDRKQQTSVKQLSFNKEKLKRKKKIWILSPIEDSQLNLLIVTDEKHVPDLFAKEPLQLFYGRIIMNLSKPI